MTSGFLLITINMLSYSNLIHTMQNDVGPKIGYAQVAQLYIRKGI